jgi:hypothetical protein
MGNRYSLVVPAVALFAMSLGLSSLATTAPADPAARGVISSDAFIEAEGCVELECDEDQKSDAGFTSFDKRASAFFRAARGKIKAHSSQNTALFAPTGDLERVVSTAAGDALFNQEPPDHRSSAFGGGRLDVSFPVDSLTDYSVFGSLRASSDPRSECTSVRILLDSGPAGDVFNFVAAAPRGCGAPSSKAFSQSGTLDPGFYSLETNVRADGTSQTRSDGFASAGYRLRFLLGDLACTIQVTQPRRTTTGTSGDDIICGSAGADTISGLGGADTVYGVGGPDTLDGNGGSDVLLGAEGADCLDGGSNRDKLSGEAGNDKLLAKDGTKDEVNGGPKPDRGRFDPRDDVRSVSDSSFTGSC